MVLLHKNVSCQFLYRSPIAKPRSITNLCTFEMRQKLIFFGLSKSSTIGVNFLVMNILGENILGLSILGVNILGPNNQNLWWFRSAVRGLQEHH